ncbi:MAG: class I tRNA ligase family protein, partial [Phycisphaerae bacterium]
RKVPSAERSEDLEQDLMASLHALPRAVGEDIEGMHFKAALGRIMEGFRACNRYIDTRAPWSTRKTDRPCCAATIHTCIQAVRTLGVLLVPFLPFASEKIRISLNVEKEAWTWPRATEALVEGHSLGPVPEVLFRKIDPKTGGGKDGQ